VTDHKKTYPSSPSRRTELCVRTHARAWRFELAVACLAYVGCLDTETVVNPNYHGEEVNMAAQPATAAPGFETQVRPILESHCALCHTGSSGMAGVDLSEHHTVLAQVLPGQPEGSKLYRVLVNKVMPPVGLPPVADSDIDLIRQWIAGGAQP
jgi:uncharacterized membrane protein